MTVAELRELGPKELTAELLRLRKEQFNLRMQSSGGQLAQVHLLKEARRDIARVKTVMRQQSAQQSGE